MGLRQEGAARRRKVENILIGTKEKDNQDKLCFIIALLSLVVNSCSYDLGTNHFEFGAHAWSLPPALFRPLLSFPSSALDHPLALGIFGCFVRENLLFSYSWEFLGTQCPAGGEGRAG